MRHQKTIEAELSENRITDTFSSTHFSEIDTLIQQNHELSWFSYSSFSTSVVAHEEPPRRDREGTDQLERPETVPIMVVTVQWRCVSPV